VRCNCAARDYGKSVDPAPSQRCRMALANGGVFIVNRLCGVGEVVVGAVFPFPYLNLCNGGVTSTAVCMSNESRFEEPDEVSFVSGGSQY
jgi:hypothetical protein